MAEADDHSDGSDIEVEGEVPSEDEGPDGDLLDPLDQAQMGWQDLFEEDADDEEEFEWFEPEWREDNFTYRPPPAYKRHGGSVFQHPDHGNRNAGRHKNW